MRRIVPLGISIFILAISLIGGCSKKADPKPDVAAKDPATKGGEQPVAPPVTILGAGQPAIGSDSAIQDVLRLYDQVASAPLANPQINYDAALFSAVNLRADRRYPEALKALEGARAIQDTEQVRLEIEKLRQRIDLHGAAERTLQDIRASSRPAPA